MGKYCELRLCLLGSSHRMPIHPFIHAFIYSFSEAAIEKRHRPRHAELWGHDPAACRQLLSRTKHDTALINIFTIRRVSSQTWISSTYSSKAGRTSTHRSPSISFWGMWVHNDCIYACTLQDDDGWTPLHVASACNAPRVVSFLISRGADLTVANADGCLPIDVTDDEQTKAKIKAAHERLGLLACTLNNNVMI